MCIVLFMKHYQLLKWKISHKHKSTAIAGQYFLAKSVIDFESNAMQGRRSHSYYSTDQQELIILLYKVFLLVILSILTVLL